MFEDPFQIENILDRSSQGRLLYKLGHQPGGKPCRKNYSVSKVLWKGFVLWVDRCRSLLSEEEDMDARWP